MRLAEILLALALLLWLSLPTLAEKTECGTGLAYGKDHAYFITAPQGWLLDTESGASQGVYAVFYPQGSSWNGPAVMYSNAAGRDGRSPDEAIEHDEQEMHKGNDKLKVVDGGTIKTKDNKTAIVKYFTGDICTASKRKRLNTKAIQSRVLRNNHHCLQSTICKQ
ncbi:MAG: hypothetical protein WC028_21175 [Candidatus Obscuribacterales bacterium]